VEVIPEPMVGVHVVSGEIEMKNIKRKIWDNVHHEVDYMIGEEITYQVYYQVKGNLWNLIRPEVSESFDKVRWQLKQQLIDV